MLMHEYIAYGVSQLTTICRKTATKILVRLAKKPKIPTYHQNYYSKMKTDRMTQTLLKPERSRV